LIDYTFARLETDHGPSAVKYENFRGFRSETKAVCRDLLCLVQTSRHGLLESELSDLLGLTAPKFASLILGMLPAYTLYPRSLCYWKGMELILRKIGAEGQFDFFHRQLAKAVVRRYLKDEPTKRSYHKRLASYYEKQAELKRVLNMTEVEIQPRAISALPHHLLHSDSLPSLVGLLTDLQYITRKALSGNTYELIADFLAAEAPLTQKYGESYLWAFSH